MHMLTSTYVYVYNRGMTRMVCREGAPWAWSDPGWSVLIARKCMLMRASLTADMLACGIPMPKPAVTVVPGRQPPCAGPCEGLSLGPRFFFTYVFKCLYWFVYLFIPIPPYSPFYPPYSPHIISSSSRWALKR